jgi:hypothetical protein
MFSFNSKDKMSWIRRTVMAILLPCSFTAMGIEIDRIERDFISPPEETRPWCYWYWLSGHISREGITKDLEAMARWGIGEALIGDINRPIIPRGPIEPLSDEYFSMLEHAVREGRRLGVHIGLLNCPGWSQTGGPWIRPEQSMRFVVSTELRVSGPMRFEGPLPEPPLLQGPGKSAELRTFKQEVAVLAFPAPRGDSVTAAAFSPEVTCVPSGEHVPYLADGRLETVARVPVADRTVVVELKLAEPFTARSLTLYPPSESVERGREKAVFDADCELLAEGDDGTFESLRKFRYERKSFSESVGPMPRGPVTVGFKARQARRFRIVFTGIKLHKDVHEICLAEIELSAAARMDHYIEQQLGKMYPGIQPPWDYYLWPTQPEPEAGFTVPEAGVIDLSHCFASDGTLRWDVPEGDWVIARFVMKSTGVKNRPAAPEATGLEADKMSPAVMEAHFDAYVGRLLSRMPSEERSALRHIVVDSYETGSQNWTDEFERQFRRSCGYDPRPWLPVLTGRIVETAEHSARFLWDLRRLVADRVADTYGSLREQANRRGLKLWLEPYGHYGFPAEFLQCGGRADGVGGEFWISPQHGDMEVLAAVSAGRIYGKRVISAEAFTGSPSYGYTQDPWQLKALGDLQATMGVNHFVLHVYIHQTYDDKQPGMNAWFGTEFNRHNTWFEMGKPWIDYLRRSHSLLQQGTPVVDVAYFIGEDAPKMSGIRQPELPNGYSFDYINGEVIRERLKVKNGRFVLPDGMSYRLLVLPPLDTMRPALLEKLRDLILAGGAVLGSPPSRSSSLHDYPAADRRVKQFAEAIWGTLDGRTKIEASIGRGRIFWGIDVKEALERLAVQPDLLGLEVNARAWNGPSLNCLPWTHRETDEGDIYFISNQTDETISVNASFRIADRLPELWDAVTGDRRQLPEFHRDGNRLIVPLRFAPRQSHFIVFRQKTEQRKGQGRNFADLETVYRLNGSWKVSFDPALGGPGPVVFDSLEDWIRRPETGIRHYSGTAVYRTEFALPALAAGRRVYLDLGDVRSLARVRLNGADLGVVWCAPWHTEATSALKEGKNTLEIEVTNTWINRLLADEKLPEDQRVTWVAREAIRAQKPQTSGLLGPVTVKVER